MDEDTDLLSAYSYCRAGVCAPGWFPCGLGLAVANQHTNTRSFHAGELSFPVALNIQCPCAQIILKGAALDKSSISSWSRSFVSDHVIDPLHARALSHPYLSQPYCHYYEFI